MGYGPRGRHISPPRIWTQEQREAARDNAHWGGGRVDTTASIETEL